MINLGERVRDGVLYIPGTDELSEWLHHITFIVIDDDGRLKWETPRQREIAEAERIVFEHDITAVHTIVGLSLGAAIAQMVAALIFRSDCRLVNVYLIGGKRSVRGFIYTRAESIRNAGDVVTAMPPWRPKNPNQTTRGPWRWPWQAHAWDNYRDLLKRFGAI